MLRQNIKIKLLGILLLSMLGVFLGFKYLLPLFTPFIISYFFVWILMPVVTFLNKRLKVPRLVASIISLVLFGGGFLWIVITLIHIFISQMLVFLKNLPIYLIMISTRLESICKGCDGLLGMEIGTVKGVLDSNMENLMTTVKDKVIPGLTQTSLTLAIGLVELIAIILIIIVTTLLLLKDKETYLDSLRKSIFYTEIRVVTSKLSDTGIAYIKTQAILMALISACCFFALFMMGNKYALLIGIGIGVLDAFPLLGSGIILVPWGVIELMNKDIKSAAILLTLYVVCQLIRQFLEPRILGERIGVLPLYTMMSMYVGVGLFGLLGFILGPIGLIIIVTIMAEARVRMANVNIKSE